MQKFVLATLAIGALGMRVLPCVAQSETGPSGGEGATPGDADFQSDPVRTTYRSGTSAKVPFEMMNGEIVVTANINGVAELKLIVDTGMVNSALAEESVRGAYFPRSPGSYPIRGIGKDLLWGKRSENLRMIMSGMTLNQASLLIVSGESFVSPVGAHIDGFLGYDILKNYVIKIDYINATIEFMDPSAFNSSVAGMAVPITIENGRIYVTAVLRNNGVASEPTPFLMDTGCSVGMVLFRQFLHANPRLSFPNGVERQMQGVGGPLIVEAVPCTELRFGNVAMQDPYVQIMEQDPVGFSSLTGLIGNLIWKRFDVTIDFPGKQLFLKENILRDGTVRYVHPSPN